VSRFSPLAGNTLAITASLLLLLFLCKVIFHLSAFKEDLKHPVFSSILPTFSMALMIVSTFLAKGNYDAGRTVWFIAIGLHVALMINFLITISRGFDFLNIVPSYFIPVVGIVVACVTGKGFYAPALCLGIFYFGFFTFLVLLGLVLARLSKGALPNPKKPTLAVLAAPASLCLAGYLSLAEAPPIGFMYLLIPLAVVLTGAVYVLLFRLLRMPFNPGFSAFTFPLVISATALLKLAGHPTVKEIGWSQSVNQIGTVELVIAAAMVLYVRPDISGTMRRRN
jgi:tellurite resistance protein TehA-like permease